MRFAIAITANPVLRPILSLFGVRRTNSWVELDTRGLTVRMGSWFEEMLPLADIAGFGPSEWPGWGGYGVRIAPRQGLGIVASTEGVVHIALRQPRRMRIVITSRDTARLWLSLERRDDFLAALARLTGLPVGAPVGFWRA